MNSTLRVILATLSLLVATAEAYAARRGGEVGNGGDVVYCQASSTTAKPALSTLDYLLAPPSQPIAGFDSLNSIFETLRVRHPGLSRSLYEFIHEIKNESASRKNVWAPAHYGLTTIDDEMVTQKLPPHCKQWQQAVIQNEVGTKHYYNYDAALLTELEKTPLQYSYLLIHEWLWRFADNALQVRLATQYLHEQSTASVSAYELQKVLSDMGLQLPSYDPTSAYRLTAEVNGAGVLQTRLLEIHEGVTEPILLTVTNHSQRDFELRLDDNSGYLDLLPERLEAGGTVALQIPSPSALVLHEKNGGWPAVQIISVRKVLR